MFVGVKLKNYKGFFEFSWLPKGHKSLTKISAMVCDLEIPDEFFELNPEIEREEYEEELLKKFETN